MKLDFFLKWNFLTLSIATWTLPAIAHGCNSSLFSEAGQQRFIQFVIICVSTYILLLLAKTLSVTWISHRSGFWRITLRTFSGALFSLLLGSIVLSFSYLNLVHFFSNPLVCLGLFVFFVSLSSTLSDSIFALNWQKLGLKEISLSLFLSLLFNCSYLVVIYLSFFANVKSFFE